MKDTSVGKEFGSSFEEKIIQAMLGDPRFGEQIIEILSPELFDMDHMKNLAEIIKSYYFKHSAFPSADLLQSICKKESDEASLDLCLNYLKKIKAKPLNGDSDWVKENSLKYFKTQNLKNTLIDKVIPRIETANYEEIVPIMQRAMQMGEDRDLGLDYNEDDEVRFVEENENKIGTPWEILNKYLNGGWGQKRLVTLIGPQGIGKSHFLVNVGVGALLGGKTVVHYTLELDQVDVARRYDASLTGVKINDVPGQKSKVLALLKQSMPKNAHLIIKEYPIKYASMQTVKSHLSRLRIKGIVPDVIVIDYGDYLRSVGKESDGRQELISVWRDMKSFAQEFKIPVVTATQTNRTGVNSDLITVDQVGEDFTKCQISDVIVTIARNMEQKKSGIGKMFLAKNRQGYDGQVFGYSIDTAKSMIDCFELTEEIEEKIEEAFKSSKTENELKSMEKFMKGSGGKK